MTKFRIVINLRGGEGVPLLAGAGFLATIVSLCYCSKSAATDFFLGGIFRVGAQDIPGIWNNGVNGLITLNRSDLRGADEI